MYRAKCVGLVGLVIKPPLPLITIDLKIDNLDRVSIPTKIVATFDVEHPILGTTNEHPKSVNSGKITSAQDVFYLNLNLLAQNSANCSDTGI